MAEQDRTGLGAGLDMSGWQTRDRVSFFLLMSAAVSRGSSVLARDSCTLRLSSSHASAAWLSCSTCWHRHTHSTPDGL